MATIKSLSKCFQEVKRLTGNLLSDEKINLLLDEAKIKINENKFQGAEVKSEKILAQEIIDKFEYDQVLKKRNLAESNMKALERYEKIIDAVDTSNGKINPIEAVRGYLVGMQKFSKITRDSIGLKQATLENDEIRKLVNAIRSLGKDAWNDFSEGRIDLEIMREMIGEPTGVKGAKDIARILKQSQNSWRLRLNDLGANIGELDDWITRTTHNTEKMAAASKGSRLLDDNRLAWVEYIQTKLNLKRTFPDVNDPIEINKILSSIYDSLMTGDHLKYGGTNSIYGTKNVTNRLNSSRVLHFKDLQARQEYNIKFGEPSLQTSVFNVLTSSAKNIVMMQELGTNPQDTFNKILALLKKKYKSSDYEIVRDLNFENFKGSFAEIDGSANIAGSQILAKIGEVVRSTGDMARLGGTVITSFADLGPYMTTTNFQGRGLLTGLFEAINGLLGGNNKAAMEALEVISNSVVVSNRGNVYADGADGTGAINNLRNKFFKWNGLNGWVASLKSSMALGVSKFYGSLSETKFLDLEKRERNFLTLYGIDEGKWNMLRSIKTLAVDNKRYLTAEAVDDISDDVINKYLGRKLSAREIRNFKKDLQLTWKNVLNDQGTHGTPEPDTQIRSITRMGTVRGTAMGEVNRFVMQYKNFAVSLYKKILRREMDSYGPDESKLIGASMLASTLMLGTIFGYIVLSVKDMLSGRSPRDPKKSSVIMQAFVQGGGAGIYGDFLMSEIQNQYGNGVLETAAGPTAGDIKKLIDVVRNMNEPKKAGKKFLQLAEGHTPFINLYYTKAAYDYLIGYQIKEYLDPGFFNRMKKRNEENRGQTYYFKP
jgi:hypothetical protein|tara:strand:- start:44 stop:2521 length:2478 start_codon:yes stop_codon:yes gene_type:complete